MKLNAAILEACAINGTITKSQAEHAGIEFPLTRGWIKKLIGREVSQDWIDEFRRRRGVRAKKVREKAPRELRRVDPAPEPYERTPKPPVPSVIGKLFNLPGRGYLMVVELADGFATLQQPDGLQIELPDSCLPIEWFFKENYPAQRMNEMKTEFVRVRERVLISAD